MRLNRLIPAILSWALFFTTLLPARPKVSDCDLPAPASLEASVDAASVSLSWAEVPGAQGYHVQVYTLPDGQTVRDFECFELTSAIGELLPGGAYRCAVTALCSSSALDIHGNTIVIDIVLNNFSPGDETPSTTPTNAQDATALPVSLAQNPFSDRLRLFVPVSESTPVHIRLFRSDGRLALERTLVAEPESWLELPAEALEKGWYWVRIETQNGARTLLALKL